MRRVLIGDLVAAAAVLAALPDGESADMAQKILTEADAAHRYFKRFHRPHPRWGDGSLITRALGAPQRVAPDLSRSDFLIVLAQMTRALAHRKPHAHRRFDLPKDRPIC